MSEAALVLADGGVFRGQALGAATDTWARSSSTPR